MQIKQNDMGKEIRVRDHPLQRSTSVSGIIHGDFANNKSNHYIDSLQRFQRDFASIDKQQRQNKRKQKQGSYERRRNLYIERQNVVKQNQDENVNKMKEKQHRSQMLHAIGAKITAHTESIPVNPINLQYDNNMRGKHQEEIDKQSQINKYVRSHNLQTQGTSGYNLITGKALMPVQTLIPNEAREVFERKIANFYSKYKITPEGN